VSGGHDHGPSTRSALTISIAANGILLAVQVVVGLVIGSLALLADSLHNASDVVALVVALVGQILLTRPPTSRRTYGYARAEVLAALLNGAVLLAITAWVVVEAIGRFGDPPEIQATPLFVVGVVGIAINGGSAWLLARSGRSLNVRAAFWHLAGDALGSLGVVIAAIGVGVFGAEWADPVASIVISLLVIVAVLGVLRDSVTVLLEAVPKGMDLDEVTSTLADLPGVVGVHHVHVWSLDSETPALTAHLRFDHGVSLHDAQAVATTGAGMLEDRFGIGHATLQPECEDCEPADGHVDAVADGRRHDHSD
jgi:cobalt-zinc-cadmium efflux system protein